MRWSAALKAKIISCLAFEMISWLECLASISHSLRRRISISLGNNVDKITNNFLTFWGKKCTKTRPALVKSVNFGSDDIEIKLVMCHTSKQDQAAVNFEYWTSGHSVPPIRVEQILQFRPTRRACVRSSLRTTQVPSALNTWELVWWHSRWLLKKPF